ncbi:MFS transporter [Rothia sp. P7181]|uniref:MFS transporter n=1 Tax=unclassified Rothia (in: high G+C Gram-positive bacteria) TaxID=2689056 RepID=UPI003AD244BA
MVSTPLSRKDINTWYRAILAIFFASGLALSGLLARLPDIAHGLDLSAGPMGLLLLAQTLGSFLAVTVSGVLVSRFGARRCLSLSYLISTCGLAGVGIAVHHSNIPLAVICLSTIGLGSAVSNVSANVQGVAVERALGRFVTSTMHGFFSIGTVVGALLSALDTQLGIPFLWHSIYFACLIAIIVAYSIYQCHSEHYGAEDTHTMQQVSSYRVRDAWRDKHTIFIGLFVLGMALAEGSANDWAALALTQEYGAGATTGSIGYAVFVGAMTFGRLSGTWFLNRYGRVPVIRATCTLALCGLSIFILAPNILIGFFGLLIWGIGVSLGFPTGMSAASDDPHKSAVRVSVVSTIGYAAFLGGPPLLGLLGEHFGIRQGLSIVLGFILLSMFLTKHLRPPEKTTQHRPIYTESLPIITSIQVHSEQNEQPPRTLD